MERDSLGNGDLLKSETRESFLGAASQLITAIVLCTCDESYQGEGEGGSLLTQNTFVECGGKITISEELVSVLCKTTKFLGLSPIPEFIQKHFLMKLVDRQTKFSGKKVLILPY